MANRAAATRRRFVFAREGGCFVERFCVAPLFVYSRGLRRQADGLFLVLVSIGFHPPSRFFLIASRSLSSSSVVVLYFMQACRRYSLLYLD